MKRYEFDHIVAAGSWDHFHRGHEKFLKKAFAVAKFVSVGIASHKMVTRKPFAESIENVALRKR